MTRLCRTLAIAGAFGCAGCSFSGQLEDMFSRGDSKSDSVVTGSITPAKTELPPESDLAYARAAASEVLARGDKDAAMPWENPGSGARGTVTALASAYTQDGVTCRDFLASHVSKGSESWMQGEACAKSGKWEVRSIKPWKRT